MSGAVKVLGRQIEAFLLFRYETGTESTQRVSVGEVADKFEISKQTARKYLNLLRDSGIVCRDISGLKKHRGAHLYTWCGDIPF